MFINHNVFTPDSILLLPLEGAPETWRACALLTRYTISCPFQTGIWLQMDWPSSGLPSVTGSSIYALRENGYWGCHQSKSRMLCTGSRMTCTPCSLRSFRPPWTGESWNTSLTRWCRMSVLTLIVNWEGKINSVLKLNNLVFLWLTLKWDNLENWHELGHKIISKLYQQHYTIFLCKDIKN